MVESNICDPCSISQDFVCQLTSVYKSLDRISLESLEHGQIVLVFPRSRVSLESTLLLLNAQLT